MMACGLRLLRLQLLRVMAQLDPEAHQARQERLIPRQVYTQKKGMVVWHFDSEPLYLCIAIHLTAKLCAIIWGCLKEVLSQR